MNVKLVLSATATAFAVLVFVCSTAFQAKAAPVDVKTLYTIKAKNTSVKKGATVTAGFAILLTKTGTKVHPQAPFKCSVSTSKGVTAKKKKLGHDDKTVAKDGKSVDVGVDVTGTAVGNQQVTLDCSFFVCTKDICARTTEKINVTTKVTE